MVSIARRAYTQAAIALLALLIFLPPPSGAGSHAGAPAPLAPLLFDHLRPLTPVYGAVWPSRPGREMAAGYASRCLAPPAQWRHVPRLPVWRRAPLALVNVAASPYAATRLPRAPPNV